MHIKKMFFVFVGWFISIPLISQNPWDGSTYPDETGFMVRMAPMLQRIADKGFATRSLSRSTCPDTGLPVTSWALEGETVYSPYTGRAYLQGPVGYFGALKRNEAGEIIRFSGDPLKTELTPATATLLLDQDNPLARAFLSIPGNMRQQYHFACKNWCRFYPMLGHIMGDEWNRNFIHWVGIYEETRRPSDGDRQYLPLDPPHHLVGQPGHLLGGNMINGGTENHKTMWRTSGLLYSQLFPDTAMVSGFPVKEAEALTKEMIRDYLQRMLYTGNGEYDSQVYYPHSIEPFMNLYDFTPDPQSKALAKLALDYYFVTFGLKVVDGAIAGAQKRGYLPRENPSEMETMLWGYFDGLSRDMSSTIASLHQVTTTYRPNRIIGDIINKNIDLPFEARMARPFYHMNHPFSFAEYFYCSESFALGSVQMTILDNPNQQMIWSLIARGDNGPLSFSGGHPMRQSTSGHSPYTQVAQSKGTMIVMTAPTNFVENQEAFVKGEHQRRIGLAPDYAPDQRPGLANEVQHRQRHGAAELKPFVAPENNTPQAYIDFWEHSRDMAATWFFYPNTLQPILQNGHYYFEANNTLVAVIPLSGPAVVVSPDRSVVEQMNGGAQRFFANHQVLAFPGEMSGYIVETGERSAYESLSAFAEAVTQNTRTSLENLTVDYQSLAGDHIVMQYFPEGLRSQVTINGEWADWDVYTDGAVYISPYVHVKEGVMTISNGRESYTVDFTGEWPEYR